MTLRYGTDTFILQVLQGLFYIIWVFNIQLYAYNDKTSGAIAFLQKARPVLFEPAPQYWNP